MRLSGGNIVVERMEGDAIFLRPDLREHAGWWFYWTSASRSGQVGR